MKHFLLLFVATLCIISCTKQEKIVAPKAPPSDWFYNQRAFPYDKIDHKALIQATKNPGTHLRGGGFDNAWDFKGPTNVGGRITDVEMFSDDMNTILAGSASGGVFRSIDQGANWEPIFDEAMSLSIGDMALAPSDENTIYVGTGESNAGGGSLAYDGVGVYRSDDRGNSWRHIGLEGVGSIGRVAIDPNDTERAYVAAMGRLFGNSSERGIYRTTDGGASWDNVLNVSDSTGGIDVVVDPTDGDVVYAAMWERRRRPNFRDYGGATSGVHKSIDGGETWTELLGGLPVVPEQKGRIGLAIAKSNPNTLYAYYGNRDGSLHGVYRSTDAGENWTFLNSGTIDNVSFIWWFGKIWVNPVDENDVYVASLNMHRTTNGGTSWNNVFPDVHVDQHAIFIHPMDPDLVINGNDGGIHISYNGGATWVKGTNLPNIQFYTCEISESNPANIFGGTQDNGTNMTETGGIDDWFSILGGDGFRVQADPTNSNIVYAEFQFGNMYRIENLQGYNFISQTIPGLKNWNTPFTLDPNDSQILYYGSDRVYKSEDRGNNWTPISEALSNGPYEGNLDFGTLTYIDVSPENSNHIAAGTDDGNLWITTDGGSAWTKASGLAERWITGISWDPFDSDRLVVSFSGFRFNEDIGHAYLSDDAGQNWSDISTTLPDIPFNDILFDGLEQNTLYLATDIGVYFSLDAGNSWNILGTDLPRVPILDIDLHLGSRKLLAATYGRSMYSYDLPFVSSNENVPHDMSVKLFPNPTSEYLTFSSSHAYKQLSIVDLTGKMIQSIDVDCQAGCEVKLDVSSFGEGMYYLYGATGDSPRFLSQFVKI